MPSFPFSLFSTEIALITLALGGLLLDIFLKDDEKRGTVLANIAMIGLSVTFAQLLFQWGRFGSAFKGSFMQDELSFYFKLLFLLAGFLVLFMAREYQSHLKRGHGEFVLLILFSLVGMSFLISANDFLVFFVALETLTISLYIMTTYLRDENASIEAGAKYLVLGAISTAVFLYGLSFIYGVTGSTSFGVIQAKMSSVSNLPLPFLFGVVLVIASLCFKIAAVPFQFWAPDIYQGAPTPVTAFLAIGSKAAGFAGLVRLLFSAFSPAVETLAPLFALLAALTIIYGNCGAIPQSNIKRLLGYSSIGHAGYMMIGLVTFAHTGKESLLYYLLTYLFSTGGAFLVLLALCHHLKTDSIEELSGLSRKSPLLAAAMLISLLSLAGVPPMAGFFAKFYLLFSAVESGYLWLAVIGALNVITSLYYYLKVIKVIYMQKSADDAPIHVSFDKKVMQYFTMAAILILGIYQGPFVRFVEQIFLR